MNALTSIYIKTIVAGLLILPSAVGSDSRAKSVAAPREYAFHKLRASGISQSLIALLEQVEVLEDRDKIVEMNVLGFLGKADYSGHHSPRAIRECAQFIRKHGRKLKRVESSSGVPKEVIAALLWVETKHGTHTGKHNVASVYFSLLQSDHPEVIRTTLSRLSARAPASISEYKQKVIDRSIAKSNWALTELKSLDRIHRQEPTRLMTLSGSYAGAFGAPQFIPSSYLQWSRSDQKSRYPDLFNMDDAIQSVAFYLKANGWKASDPATHQAALFHYNRAQGYVDVILKIAADLKSFNVPTRKRR